MQQRQPEKDPFRMFKPAKIGAGRVFKTDLGAVVGMGAPADVMQKAGRLDQPFLRVRGRAEQRQDEVIERAPETGKAGVLLFRETRRFDKRIPVAQGLRHLFVKKTFADTIARNGNVLRAEGLHKAAEHIRGKRDKCHTCR